MATEKKFIKKAIRDFEIKRFLKKKLEKAGVSQINIQKTPLATRVTLFVRRPGIVVGRKGSSIKELCSALERKFSMDNPQLDIIEVENPSLDAQLVAEKIGKQIEFRGNVKQAVRFALREVKESGAIGVEIRASGKVVGKGGKARAITARMGYLKKSGHYVKFVNVGNCTAYLRAGAIGIRVKIVPPHVVFPDVINLSKIKQLEEKKKEENQEPKDEAEKVAEEKIEEAKKEEAKPKKKAKKKAKKAKDDKKTEKTQEKTEEVKEKEKETKEEKKQVD
ncbi:MAG: 30S ribosomal protein S3 [Candidatus Micrarchaeia archaeon]